MLHWKGDLYDQNNILVKDDPLNVIFSSQFVQEFLIIWMIENG